MLECARRPEVRRGAGAQVRKGAGRADLRQRQAPADQHHNHVRLEEFLVLEEAVATFHTRRAVGIRMTLPTTGRLFWHCEDHTAKPESA